MCNCNTNGYQAGQGWGGSPGIMVSTPLVSCGNNAFPAQPCPPYYPCAPNGCPIQLDSACVIYHKNGNMQSNLPNLGIQNGSTLELILETIDTKIGVLNVLGWAIPYLRGKYPPINTLQQFGVAVDTEFASLNSRVTTIEGSALVALQGNDSPTIHWSLSGTLNRILFADVKLSANPSSTLTVVADGIVGVPQTLSIDYINKTLSITKGNTVDFSSLICGASGFLGNVNTDPNASDGQYWFRIDLPAASGLRIKVNGTIRTIPTT